MQSDFQRREMERVRRYRAEHGEEERARRRAAYDPEQARVKRERYRKAIEAYEVIRTQDPSRKAFNAQWKKEHPEARHQWYVTRTNRQGGVTQNFSKAVRQGLWLRQLGECGLCGAGMERMEIDHRVPLCAGGPHEIENVHLVHPECNRKKGRRLHAV